MKGSPASREERQLRRAMRDLVALSSLPAVWSAFEPEGIADSLGEVLLRILEPDFVFVTVRLGDEPAISRARGRGRSDAEAAALYETLAPWLGADSPEPPAPLQDPSGAGRLQVALARFGHSGDHGVVLALSRRDSFPTDVERLLLGVGANHTATVLQRKRDEAALREAAERKDEFLAMLGHELRNPLAPIRNSLQILNQLESDPQAHRKVRGVMERQLVHLTRLVDDLLDVSRISRGKIQLRNEDLELRELVGHTVDDHRHAMTEAGLHLDLELPSDDLWIRGDRVRLAQSLGNLLENACKFSEGGGRVAVTVTRDGPQAVVRVVDEGVGIPPDDLPRIFETFSQSGAAREHSRTGLGLGLSVVKSLVELHDGSVRAHSDGPGRGAELVLRLPLLEERAPAAEAPSGDSAEGSPDHRVLVIEDHVDSAETLSELLRLHGHRVEVAHDGSQGIARAREFRPDIVLCDIGLPGGLDGYEVARSLRRDAALGGPFLVALTGFGQESDRERAREAGFDAHLTKPADPSALKRLLAERRTPVSNGS